MHRLPRAARRRAAYVLSALAAAVVLPGCGADPVATTLVEGPRSVTLRIVAGDVQVGPGGRELPDPLRVQVVDQANRPVAGYVVNFRVLAGGGSVFAGSAATDAQGRAADRWTLGPASPDTQRVEVRAVDPATGAAIVFATFRAIGQPDGSGSVRIVLAWGAAPRNLDAQLEGPTTAGPRFRVNSLVAGTCAADPFVCKDGDALNGYGPESITIGRQQPGTYRFSVVNTSGEAPIGASARVDVYVGGQLVQTISPTASAGGDWNVFELTDGQITVLNTFIGGTPATVGVATVGVTPSSVQMLVGGTQQLTAQLRDAGGSLLTDRVVRWSSANSAIVSIDPLTGLATAVAPGTTSLTATSEGHSGSATVQVSAASQRIAIVGPNPLSVALHGSAIARAQVTDAAGAPLAGIPVTFEQTGYNPLTTPTDAAGQIAVNLPTATAGSYSANMYIGQPPYAGAPRATLAYTVGGGASTSSFNIEVRYVGTVPAKVTSAVTAAVARARSLVTAGTGTQTLTAYDMSACGNWIPSPLTVTVNSQVLFVTARNIDGVGNVLAQAGPCLTWTGTLVSVSTMELDASDLNRSQADIDATVLHELMHVLGIGTQTQWDALVARAGTADPVFTGATALSQWLRAGGARWNGTAIPVENLGGAGSADSHWRKSILGGELMTSTMFANERLALSAITVGALRDLGYAVDYTAADAYVAPQSSVRLPSIAIGDAPHDVVLKTRIHVAPKQR